MSLFGKERFAIHEFDGGFGVEATSKGGAWLAAGKSRESTHVRVTKDEVVELFLAWCAAKDDAEGTDGE